jgi:hypothetical protein
MGTDDDLVSWALDDVMRLARGPRWTAAAVGTRTPADPTQPALGAEAKPRPGARPPARRGGTRQDQPPDGIIDLDGDGIPDSR